MPHFVPTIDIYNGNVVLVKKGKVVEVIDKNPMNRAEFLSIASHFQVVDLNAAMDDGNNRELIKKICTKYPCYVGGGIRNYDDAIEYLNASARRVVISTNASVDLFKKLPKDRIILGLDIDEKNNIFTHGRNILEKVTVFEKIDEFKDCVEMITITFHHTEGTCNGIPMSSAKELYQYVQNYGIKLCVAGGINSVEQITSLHQIGIIPQFGAGFSKGYFSLGEVYAALMNREKAMTFNDIPHDLFPTIVQHKNGVILGQVYSTLESIQISVDTRVATFYSRDRNKLWIKGATSNHYHTVIYLHFSCDESSLRMIVDGDVFCHTGQQSCFGYCDPSRWGLQSIQQHLRKSGPQSYATKLINNPKYARSKILEEAEELVHASKSDMVMEAADLVFHMLSYLESFEVPIDDVYKELNKRRYIVEKKQNKIQRMNKEFTIGIVTNGTNLQIIFSYLKDLLGVIFAKQNDNPRSFAFTSSDARFRLVQVKPKDIGKLIHNNHIDAVVSYDDMIINSPIAVVKVELRSLQPKYVKICAIVKENITFETLQEKINTGYKLNIMSEYPELTYRWLESTKLNTPEIKVETVSGSSESYVFNDMADMCVCVVDTGVTLAANNLKILDTLVETSMHMFAPTDKIKMLEDLLKNNKKD